VAARLEEAAVTLGRAGGGVEGDVSAVAQCGTERTVAAQASAMRAGQSSPGSAPQTARAARPSASARKNEAPAV